MPHKYFHTHKKLQSDNFEARQKINTYINNSINVTRERIQFAYLRGLFTSFEYIKFFSCSNKRIIFCKRSISIKQLFLKIVEKIGCSKSVRPSIVIYIIYITRTDFEHHFSYLFHRDGPFIKMFFFCWDTKKMLYIQNWWTYPFK